MGDRGLGLLDCFYGMTPPDNKHMVARMKKVAKIKANMGDKYLLSKTMGKLNDDRNGNGKR